MAEPVPSLISLHAARAIIIDHVSAAPPLSMPLAECGQLVLAQDIVAAHNQPWAALSAMDGYAVRSADCVQGGDLSVIGESRASQPFNGSVEHGQAVMISTGAAVPDGADHIIMVEQTQRHGDMLTITAPQSANGFIREKGRDFASGDILLNTGQVLAPAHIALAAAAGCANIMAVPRPKIAVLTNGDELLDPGCAAKPGCLYDSNGLSLAAQCTLWGADAQWLGRAGDDAATVAGLIDSALDHDIIVIAGGASVGQHDHVRASFAHLGGVMHFSKIALRPGKPAWFGTLRGKAVIGLPGNPASAFVTAELLVQLAIACFLGRDVGADLPLTTMTLDADLPANGSREGFLRGHACQHPNGAVTVQPAADQDSSLLRPLAAANVLIHRPSDAAPLKKGDDVKCYILHQLKTVA